MGSGVQVRARDRSTGQAARRASHRAIYPHPARAPANERRRRPRPLACDAVTHTHVCTPPARAIHCPRNTTPLAGAAPPAWPSSRHAHAAAHLACNGHMRPRRGSPLDGAPAAGCARITPQPRSAKGPPRADARARLASRRAQTGKSNSCADAVVRRRFYQRARHTCDLCLQQNRRRRRKRCVGAPPVASAMIAPAQEPAAVRDTPTGPRAQYVCFGAPLRAVDGLMGSYLRAQHIHPRTAELE